MFGGPVTNLKYKISARYLPHYEIHKGARDLTIQLVIDISKEETLKRMGFSYSYLKVLHKIDLKKTCKTLVGTGRN